MTDTQTPTRGTALLACKAKGRPDNFQTPEWPIKTLLDLIKLPPSTFIWEPACGKGRMAACLRSNGYTTLSTDIADHSEIGHEDGNDYVDAIDIDFLKVSPTVIKTLLQIRELDVIITNPPYSLKDEFIAQCYASGKPFALLLPLTALEGIKRQALYREHGLQVIILPKRVNYETPSGQGSGAWFPSAWFTHGFNLPNDLTFAE
jgi:hypothetical protein